MDKQDIRQNDIMAGFEEVAAIFAANGTDISRPIMRLMSPYLSGRQTLYEHRAALKSQLSEIKE